MKAIALSASALLTFIPGAALADSAIYSAVYSPAIDIATRSCTIENTGIQGENLLNAVVGTIDGIGSSNTSIMRTIGQDAGTAQSKAGIRFNMVGANILKLEESSITDVSGNPVGTGSIALNVPRAKVDGISSAVLNSLGDDLGFEPTGRNGSTVAKIDLNGGQPDTPISGSIVTGKKLDIGGEDTRRGDGTKVALAAARVSGARAGALTFTLNNIDDTTETRIIKTTVSCEPVPVQRESSGFVTPL